MERLNFRMTTTSSRLLVASISCVAIYSVYRVVRRMDDDGSDSRAHDVRDLRGKGVWSSNLDEPVRAGRWRSFKVWAGSLWRAATCQGSSLGEDLGDLESEVKTAVKNRSVDSGVAVKRNVKRHIKKFNAKYSQPELMDHPFSFKLLVELGEHPLDRHYYKACMGRLSRWYSGCQTLAEFARKEAEKSVRDGTVRKEDFSEYLEELYMSLRTSSGALYEYCMRNAIDIPILRNTNVQDHLSICYQIIRSSIALRQGLDEEEDILRSDEVRRLGKDALNEEEVQYWQRITAVKANYWLGEDIRVNPIQPGREA